MTDKNAIPHDKPLSATKIGVKDKLPVMRGSFLRFPRAMREVARVSHLGCIKYDAPEGSMDYLEIYDGIGVFTDALGRHLLDEATGGPVNVEKGGHLPPEGMAVLHAAQIAWNSLARLERYLVDLEEKGVLVADLMSDVAAVVALPSNPFGESEEVVKASQAKQHVEDLDRAFVADRFPPQRILPPQFNQPEAHTMEYPGPGQPRTYYGMDLAYDDGAAGSGYEDVGDDVLAEEVSKEKENGGWVDTCI